MRTTTQAPKGKSFRECYDVLKVTPTDEYVKVYDARWQSSSSSACR
jgi:hypothetical protein